MHPVKSGSLQIPALKLLFISCVINGIELRSKAENGSTEAAGTCCSNRLQRLPAWIMHFHGNANQIYSKELTHFESLHKLEDEEHPPLFSSPPTALASVEARQSSGVWRRRVRIE